MTAPTKGPWHVGEDQGTSLGEQIETSSGDPIAWVSPHRPQQAANARLIAAAPTMAEALLEIMDICRGPAASLAELAVTVEQAARAALLAAGARGFAPKCGPQTLNM